MTSTPETSSNDSARVELRKIRRLSGALAAACLVLLIALPAIVLGYGAVADASSLALRANLKPLAIQNELHAWQRVAGAALMMLPVGFLSAGLWQARRCFAGFAAGQLFTLEAVRQLRRFAAWVMASALAAIGVGPALSVVLTLTNAPGTRQLAIGVGSDHALTLLFAAVVWWMAEVIGQGQSLAEENAAFV